MSLLTLLPNLLHHVPTKVTSVLVLVVIIVFLIDWYIGRPL